MSFLVTITVEIDTEYRSAAELERNLLVEFFGDYGYDYKVSPLEEGELEPVT